LGIARLSIQNKGGIMTKLERNIKKLKERYPDALIEVKHGVEVDLRTLKKNESVAWGDGETCHILITDNCYKRARTE
jgi:hypothetical protein